MNWKCRIGKHAWMYYNFRERFVDTIDSAGKVKTVEMKGDPTVRICASCGVREEYNDIITPTRWKRRLSTEYLLAAGGKLVKE